MLQFTGSPSNDQIGAPSLCLFKSCPFELEPSDALSFLSLESNGSLVPLQVTSLLRTLGKWQRTAYIPLMADTIGSPGTPRFAPSDTHDLVPFLVSSSLIGCVRKFNTSNASVTLGVQTFRVKGK